MRPLQARLIFAAFLGVAITVNYNATYLQKGPHPTPYAEPATTPATSPATAREQARTEAAGDGGSSGGQPAAVASDTVRAIQRELAERGYEPGPIDGVVGWSTRAAIMAFQHDQQLGVTGEPSMPLLRHILLGGSPGGPAEPPDAAVPQDSLRLIRSVQQTLAELGYGPGPVDGIMGEGTQAAIEAFERDQGLPPTGRISGVLLRELARVTGRKPEQLAAS